MKKDPTLTILSDFEDNIIAYAMNYMENGYNLVLADYTRKYKLFGKKTWFVILTPGKKYYQSLLAKRLQEEDYEMASKLRDKIKTFDGK